MGIQASTPGLYFRDPLIREKTWRVSVWLRGQAEALMTSAANLEKQVGFPPKAHFDVSRIHRKEFHVSKIVQNAVFLEMAVFGRENAARQIGLINTAVRQGMLLVGTPADGDFRNI